MSSPPAPYSDNTHWEIIRDILKLIQVVLTSLLLSPLLQSVAILKNTIHQFFPDMFGYLNWSQDIQTASIVNLHSEKKNLSCSWLSFIALDTMTPTESLLKNRLRFSYTYMCVTGLTVRHVAEHFQHSNDMISQWAPADHNSAWPYPASCTVATSKIPSTYCPARHSTPNISRSQLVRLSHQRSVKTPSSFLFCK